MYVWDTIKDCMYIPMPVLLYVGLKGVFITLAYCRVFNFEQLRWKLLSSKHMFQVHPHATVMMTAVVIMVCVFKLTSTHMAPVTAHPDKCLMVRCVRKVGVF